MMFEWQRAGAHVQQLLTWVSEGRFQPAVGRVFAFEGFREALLFALSGKGLGKTVLSVG
jgi:NADPH2:quinone reductase